MSQINHPPHYGGGKNPYETIKVIEAWNLGFCLGNTVKYISRAEKKRNAVQDLEKALWYLAREVKKRGGDIHQSIQRRPRKPKNKPLEVEAKPKNPILAVSKKTKEK